MHRAMSSSRFTTHVPFGLPEPRRVDSGPLGDFDIFGRQSDGDSEGRGSFNFAMAEPHGSSAASSSRSTRRR